MIMNIPIRQYILAWLLLLVGSNQLWAVSPDFNPPTPPEPYIKYVVTVTSERGYASGNGKYFEGEEVFISTSSYDQDYHFRCWLKNGEEYSTDQQFTYIVEDRNVKFEALYTYDPVPPSEPVASNPYRLYLTTNKEGCCSFNRTSGEKVEAGSQIWIQAYASQGFRLLGWYEGDELISKEESFVFTMPEAHTTLTAKFVYDPAVPDEPNNPGQDNVDGINTPAYSPSIATTARIYDLSGREVKMMLPGSIYIVNKKKIAIK